MRKLTMSFVTVLLAATTAFAADRAEEARKAETAFAQAFADRDEAGFFSFVADDANFLGPKRTLAGKADIVKVWSEYFKPEKAPFSWRPERVVVNGGGDIALTHGPVYDSDGKHIANFQSIWQRQADGTWKVLFDGPGAPVCEEKK